MRTAEYTNHVTIPRRIVWQLSIFVFAHRLLLNVSNEIETHEFRLSLELSHLNISCKQEKTKISRRVKTMPNIHSFEDLLLKMTKLSTSFATASSGQGGYGFTSPL